MKNQQSPNYFYDKMRKVVLSVQHKHQFLTALRYCERTAAATGDARKTIYHLNLALSMHPTILFNPMPPATSVTLSPGGGYIPNYKVDAKFLERMLWCEELNRTI